MSTTRRFSPSRIIRRSVLAAALFAAGPAFAEDLVTLEEAARVQGLAPVKGTGFDHVFVRPGVDLSRIGTIALAPIELAIDYDRDDVLLEAPQKRHARNYFTEQLQDEFGNRLTASPDGNPARLEITVTNYVPNRSYLGRTESGRFVDKSIAVGRAAFTARLIDSRSGEVLAVIEDSEVGLPLDVNPRVFSLYGDADKFMRDWARDLASLIGSPTAQS